MLLYIPGIVMFHLLNFKKRLINDNCERSYHQLETQQLFQTINKEKHKIYTIKPVFQLLYPQSV